MSKSSTQKMQQYRRRLRGPGLRQVQIWAPDTRDPRVRERIVRQARTLSRQPADGEVDAILDAGLQNIEGWTA